MKKSERERYLFHFSGTEAANNYEDAKFSASELVFLDGFFRGNFGDDLLFYLLCSRYPLITFIAYSDYDYRWLEETLGNLVVARPRLSGVDGGPWSKAFHMAWIIRNSSLCGRFVRLGGSLYIFRPSRNAFVNSLKLFLQRIYSVASTRLYAKSFVIDSCFGPYGNEAKYLSIVRSTFRNCVDVSLRDDYSFSIFADLPQVRHNPDLAFSMGPIQRTKKRIAFISVINPWNEKKFSYQRQTCELYERSILECCGILSDKGFKLRIVSFCEKEGDTREALRICEQLVESGLSAELIEYRENLTDVMDALCESALVVASRFHAAVIALCADCALVPVIYDAKTRNMLDDIGFPNSLRIEIGVNDADLSDTALTAMERPFSIDRHVFLQAERHFSVLDKELL